MYSQYFGSYLLNKGLISNETLQVILSEANKAQVKLGVLAISKCFLTSAQVEEIHNLQRQQDKRFGEIAVNLGYMSEVEVMALLRDQKAGVIEIGQVLVDGGIFTLAELEQVLKSFKQEAEVTEQQIAAIEKGSIDEIVSGFIDLKDEEFRNELEQYVSLFWRNLIRFIDSQAFLEPSPSSSGEKLLAVELKIIGQFNLNTYLAMEEKTFLKFAEKFADMPIGTRDELANSSVAEFSNVHNGIFAVNMSEQNREQDLMPPKVIEAYRLPDPTRELTFSFNLNIGRVYLVLETA